MLIFLTYFDFQCYISSLLYHHRFSIKESIGNCLIWGKLLSFQGWWKPFCTPQMACSYAIGSQSVLVKTHQKNSSEMLRQSLIYSVLHLRTISMLSDFLFCSVGWNVDGKKLRKIPFLLRFCRPSISKIYKTTVLNSSGKTRPTWFVKIRFLFETVLLHVRSILFAPHGWKLSQFDCASSW